MLMKKVIQFYKRFPVLILFLYFLILTIVMTWPLVTRMFDAMVGMTGDNIYFVWMIGWIKKALFELHVNPFNVWFLNYPEGWSLAYTEITPIQILIALPFALLRGPTFGYNCAMILSFVLAGMSMFWWIKHLTGRGDAALIAGTAFAFIPYHFAHFLIGHLNLVGIQWFPLFFMGLTDLLGLGGNSSNATLLPEAAKRIQWRPVLLAGISLGLIGLTSQYYLYMLLFITAFMVFWRVIIMQRSLIIDSRFWKQLLLMGLVSLPLVLLSIAPYLSLFQQGGLPDRNIGIVRMYSASPTDFILPSTDHFLWGQWVGSHFNREMWVEGTLYIGVVSGVLSILALIKRKSLLQTRLIVLLFWTGLFAFILALGTDLHWNGDTVVVSIPSFLQTLLNRTETMIHLPGYYLFLYFPFFAKLRALMRFGVFVLVFTCAAAGLGSAWLINRVNPGRKGLITILVIGLLFLDLFPGPYSQFAQVSSRPVDMWLAAQPGQGAVVQMPFKLAEDQEMTYYTLVNGKPFVGGFFNAFPPAQYMKIKPILERFPDGESIQLLRNLGVQYILVEQGYYPDKTSLMDTCKTLGLKFVIEQGDQLVFEFK